MDNDNVPIYADNQALLLALRELGDSMLDRALLTRPLLGQVADAGDGKPDTLYWQTGRTQTSQQQLQQHIAQLNSVLEQQWQTMQRRLAATMAAQVFIPWIHVCELFRLQRTEQELLMFGLLNELEPRYGSVLHSLSPGGAVAAPDQAGDWVDLTGLEIVLGGSVSQRYALGLCLTDDSPLRHWDLIVLAPLAKLTGASSAYQLSPVIAAYLLAKAAPQLRLEQPLETIAAGLALEVHLVDDQVRQQLSRFIAQCAAGGNKLPSYVLQLQGPDLALERSLCAASFGQMQMSCAALDAKHIWHSYLASQKDRPLLLRRLRLLCRDAMLCNSVIVLLHCQWLSSQHESDDLLEEVLTGLLESQRFFAVLNGPARRISDLVHRYRRHEAASVLIKITVPDSRLRMQIWRRHAANFAVSLSAAVLDRLVNNYLFTEEQILMSLREVASRQILKPDETDLEELLFDTCREQSNRELLTVAQEVKTPYRFSDIVLPDATRQWLREVLQYAQQRHQVIENWGFDSKNQNSKNLCILFYGPSGTGKTMAASIIANELNLGLYKIDLANIVSKYIGETEKHLAQLFDQAEAMNIVLFFDEAESLFSKRTETRDAHDRYANLQTGYLLQRIETYPGIVILSTNLLANMDQAFTRRFKFMIEYPFPDSEQRAQLWHAAFPAATPLADDVDFSLLAKKAALSGGNINNIALSAAFLAAAEQQAIAQRHVLQATEREYHKLGKVFCGTEFSWDEDD
ncbi:MAG: ATP-binding protein [Burkholderiales bacterium]|nr:ATP-binding protein [Burkholderiales bacterium]